MRHNVLGPDARGMPRVYLAKGTSNSAGGGAARSKGSMVLIILVGSAPTRFAHVKGGGWRVNKGRSASEAVT